MIELSDGFSRGYALIVGVGADLPVTVKDAHAVAGIFRDPERCAYPPDQVHLLTEADASRDNVVNALGFLADKLTRDDTLTIYYSGHGVEAERGRYFLLTHGADHSRLDQTALDGRLFTEKLLAIPVGRLLLLLDCCRAGGIFDRTLSKAPSALRPGIPVDMRDVLARGSGTVVVASSAADEVSLIKSGYSVFTYVLIEALCGIGAANRDGYVYASDLALHTRERVPALTNDRQHPTLNFRRADNYPVAYYAAGETNLKGVPQGLLLPNVVTPDVKTVLRSIRKLLLELPIEPREVQVMVTDMDIRDVTLHYDSGPSVYWDELLRVADIRRSMEQVFEVLDPRFGDNPDWSGVKADYRAARQAGVKQPIAGSAKVLPFARPERRSQNRTTLPQRADSEMPVSDGVAILGDGLRAQATTLLSEIRALSDVGSDARFQTEATPVRLRIADMTQTISRLVDEGDQEEPADFEGVNTIAAIREKFDLINTVLDHERPRYQVDRLVEAGKAVLAAADRLARTLRGGLPGSDSIAGG